MPYTDPTKQKAATVTSQRRRVRLLDKLAQSAGWQSWSEFATAVLHCAAQMPRKDDKEEGK